MTTATTIEDAIKGFVLRQFLREEDPARLSETTPLITGGIVSSVGTLNLVEFLEDEFDIELEAQEASVKHLDTIASMAELVRAKTA